MGMSASASVVFGVDLGDREYGEIHVEVPDEFLEDGLYEGVERAINEYRTELAGAKPEKYPWDGGDREEWDRWRGASGNVGYTTYGYEFSGVVLISACAGSAEYDASPVNLAETNEEELEKFLQFLESKGWVFNPEKRKPQWLVTASYG